MKVAQIRIEDGRSLITERGIKTELPETGYIENVSEDEGNTKSVLWFYGEQLL